MPDDTVYLVTEIYPSHVVLDGNHPLAGMSLRLDMKVRGVREATEAEVEARSVSAGESPLSVLATPRGPAPGEHRH
jgi:FKBP-type peptidyl-prolyl cis-trans isomerase SlyD